MKTWVERLGVGNKLMAVALVSLFERGVEPPRQISIAIKKKDPAL